MTENEVKTLLKNKKDEAERITNNFLSYSGGEIRKANRTIEMCDMAIQALEEIQQYRAIGTIEEFKVLKDAEEQGLLLRLPCKVGDVVYFPIYDYHDSAIIETIRIEENGVFYDWVQYEVGVDCTEVWDNGSFADGNIGKTVFLTKEEAEQALKQMGE